jgi:hypothetical protein
MKNQLSFNKMIETQLAQLAASLPSESGGIPGQSEPTLENLKSLGIHHILTLQRRNKRK